MLTQIASLLGKNRPVQQDDTALPERRIIHQGLADAIPQKDRAFRRGPFVVARASYCTRCQMSSRTWTDEL
jgi:hypothetical protein